MLPATHATLLWVADLQTFEHCYPFKRGKMEENRMNNKKKMCLEGKDVQEKKKHASWAISHVVSLSLSLSSEYLLFLL